MNPLRLEEMISLFSSGLIICKTGALSASTHIRCDCSVRMTSHRLKKPTEEPVLHTDR